MKIGYHLVRHFDQLQEFAPINPRSCHDGDVLVVYGSYKEIKEVYDRFTLEFISRRNPYYSLPEEINVRVFSDYVIRKLSRMALFVDHIESPKIERYWKKVFKKFPKFKPYSIKKIEYQEIPLKDKPQPQNDQRQIQL